MRCTLWIGRVKSTCAPELLESAFAKYGSIARVETGFAGFAFVEFHSEEDAEVACKEMNKVAIAHVGEVHVSMATQRGYEEACNKRDTYRKLHGLPVRRSRSRSRSRSRPVAGARRSPSVRRHRSQSRSRSGGAGRGRRERRSLSRSSASLSRSKSVRSAKRERSRSPKLREWKGTANAPGQIQPWSSQADQQDEAAGPRILTENDVVQVSRADRSAVLCFFDGASVYDLLLEGNGISRQEVGLMEGFPHAYPNLSKENTVGLVDALLGFTLEGCPADNEDGSAPLSERSVEVRQTLSVDAQGRRRLRKALVVNGEIGFTEERAV